MILDDAAPQVLIRTTYQKGQFVSVLTGKPIPDLKEGAYATLEVDLNSFADRDEAAPFVREGKRPFLRKGTCLLARMSLNRVPHELWSTLRREAVYPHPRTESAFAVIELLEELQLFLRGEKKAALGSCRCKIASIAKEANSLNHAYTLLSEHFERKRISHAGNVFSTLYFLDKDGQWKELRLLRDQVQSDFDTAGPDSR